MAKQRGPYNVHKDPRAQARLNRARRDRHEQKERRRIFLREWRKYRKMTQEELAEAVGWSVGNVSQLETGQQGYSDEGLALLAEVLNCTPGQILDVNPIDDNEIWSLFQRAKPSQREAMLELAKGMVPDADTDR